jgi:hypothetical protein
MNPPKAGEPVAELWRIVAELVERQKALDNIVVHITATLDTPLTKGSLTFSGGIATLALS